MSLTVGFVTRNHGDSIGMAIESVRDLATQILLIDTGSDDDTCEQAAERGASVHPHSWNDDFSAACNQVLDLATGDWILILNPDEELQTTDRQAVQDALTDSTALAYRLQLWHRSDANDPTRGTRSTEDRLFRRDPALRYQGRLHPHLSPPLTELSTRQGQSVKPLNATIVRHAYRSIPTADKIRWVIRLLEAELRDHPDRLDCRIELGRNLLWLNDPRGHELLADATNRLAQLPPSSTAPNAMVGLLFEYLLTADPLPVPVALSLQRIRELVPQWFSRTPPVLWAAAQERFRKGDFAAAAKLLDRLLELGHSGWYDSPGFDPEIIGASATMNLGLCYARLENWVLARACFEHLLDHGQYGETARRLHAAIDAQLRAHPPQPGPVAQ